MDEPRQPLSNAPLYAALVFGAALTLGCLAVWFGPALLWILIVGAGLAALGGLHYWAWGRGMEPPDEGQGE